MNHLFFQDHTIKTVSHLKTVLVIFVTSAISFTNLYAQTVEEIKVNPDFYYGEGTGSKMRDAKDEALSNLLTSISLNVVQTSEFELKHSNKNGVIEGSEDFSSAMNTYSSVTLNDCHQKVLSDKNPYKVFMYIEHSKVDTMFMNRAFKVREYARIANESYLDLNIADALRYYYSAYLLAHSLRDRNQAKIEDEDGKEQLAMVWLKKRIEDILSDVSVSVLGNNGQQTNTYRLSFLYNKKPVEKIGYTYYDGSEWTERPELTIDGQGLVELRPSFSPTDMKVRIEYKYLNYASNDKELSVVYDALSDMINFGNYGGLRVQQGTEQSGSDRGYQVNMASRKEQNAMNAMASNRIPETEVSVEASQKLSGIMEQVISCINARNYGETTKVLFSEDGWSAFEGLIKYGEARIIGTPDIRYTSYNGMFYARSVPMQFRFRGNNKFTENVVFTFNKENKIDDVTFGLGAIAADNLFCNMADPSQSAVRSAVSNFLESYKTAYALGRFDYLEKVFSDDALIITGKVIERLVHNPEQSSYHMERTVQQTRHSKQEYLQHLRDLFRNKEFVNIQFADNKIRRDMKAQQNGRDVFGIQIRQDYCSSNYSDKGYLFLLVDVTKPEAPIIHVRVWQDKPDANMHVFDITDL